MSSLIVGRRSCRGVQDRLLRISEPGHSTNPARWAMRWKPALNAFVITFDDRIVPAGLLTQRPANPFLGHSPRSVQPFGRSAA